jgi:flavin-binding protein dodecin
MAESVYKVIELVGTSEDSWEKAASAAVAQAARPLRDLVQAGYRRQKSLVARRLAAKRRWIIGGSLALRRSRGDRFRP